MATGYLLEDELALKNLHSDVEETRKNVDKTAKTISTNMEKIETAHQRQIREIKNYTEQAMKDLKENETKLEKLVIDANDNLLQQLKLNLDICDENRAEIDSKIDFVTDLLKSTDISTLTETTDNLKETIKQDIEEIQAVVAVKDQAVDSAVTVNKGPNWDVTSCIQVLIKDLTSWSHASGHGIHQGSFKSHGKKEASYSYLYNCQYELVKIVQLDYYPFKACIINSDVWCAGRNAVYIYNTDGDFIKKVTHDKIQRVLTLTHCDNTGHVIVANWNNQRLHQFDSTGQYQSQIAEGSYSDTTYHDGLLYALEYKLCKVLVYKCLNNKWSEVTEFRLNYKNGNTLDRLSVYDSGILISSWNNHCLYRHSIDGQFIKQTGTGELIFPYVSSTDSRGQTVIADYNDKRVQVCDSEDRYQTVNIKGLEGCPVHVLINDNRDLFITAHNPHQLMKFKSVK